MNDDASGSWLFCRVVGRAGVDKNGIWMGRAHSWAERLQRFSWTNPARKRGHTTVVGAAAPPKRKLRETTTVVDEELDGQQGVLPLSMWSFDTNGRRRCHPPRPASSRSLAQPPARTFVLTLLETPCVENTLAFCDSNHALLNAPTPASLL